MIISHHDSSAIFQVLNALQHDKVFIYPTDTLYGFGGNALSEKVLETIYELKQRPENMPVSMLVRDRDMLLDYAHISSKADMLIEEFLPGALTLVLPAKNIDLPLRLFSTEGYLGFRIPDHEFCRNITEEFDKPIITTSVNVSGHPALNDIESIRHEFGQNVELLISDNTLKSSDQSAGSTVVMVGKDDSIRVLREGVIKTQEITRLLQKKA